MSSQLLASHEKRAQPFVLHCKPAQSQENLNKEFESDATIRKNSIDVDHIAPGGPARRWQHGCEKAVDEAIDECLLLQGRGAQAVAAPPPLGGVAETASAVGYENILEI